MIDIDVVITWVDGDDPEHRRKRLSFMTRSSRPLHDNGINPHRWADSDELNYCLRSIEKNAPWVRRVWIITDLQAPKFGKLSKRFLDKISIVDHLEIFRDHAEVLPTFNSLSIETMLWRIDGVAEHFLYFNDDVFLIAPVRPDDFFTAAGPVLRGGWTDYSGLGRSAEKRKDAAFLNHYNQLNAAEIIGFGAERAFANAHVIHPMRRSVMARLFEQHRELFVENITHRFRDTEQFLPQGLHNHACIRDGGFTILEHQDYMHFSVGQFDGWRQGEVRDHFLRAAKPDIKLLCVNDLPSIERTFPEARKFIELAIGLAA